MSYWCGIAGILKSGLSTLVAQRTAKYLLWVTLVLGASIFLHLADHAGAASFDTLITGCEAKDMREQLADTNGQRFWQGRPLEVGTWQFLVGVELDCLEAACRIQVTNPAFYQDEEFGKFREAFGQGSGINSHTSEVYGPEVVFSVKTNAGGIYRTLEGEKALDLHQAMRADSRSSVARVRQGGMELNVDRLVQMNYGYLGRINIRVRTEITCYSEDWKIHPESLGIKGPSRCALVDSSVVYINYDEDQECVESEALPELLF